MCESRKNREDFASRLRQVREAANLSQADLAKKAGLQPSAVSHFETKQRAPSFHNLRRLADALDVTIDFLLGRETPSDGDPTSQMIARHVEKMTVEDRKHILKLTERLAKKERWKRKEDS